MLVRVFLAASRLQLRSLDAFVLHTSHRGAAARAVGMNPKASTQLRVVEWTSFRRAFEQDTQPSLGTTVAFRKLLPEKTLTASPLGVPPILDWLFFLFSRAVAEVCERGHRRHCAGFAGIARATQPGTPTDTLQHFGSIKLAANQTVSVKAMLKDDKAPEIRTAALLIPVSVHQAHA